MAIDPVCNMEVDESSEYKTQRGSQVVYFCCEECKREFDRDPSRFAPKRQAQQ